MKRYRQRRRYRAAGGDSLRTGGGKHRELLRPHAREEGNMGGKKKRPWKKGGKQKREFG